MILFFVNLNDYSFDTQERLEKLCKVQKLLVLRDISMLCDDQELIQEVDKAFSGSNWFSLCWKYFGQEDFSGLGEWALTDPFFETCDSLYVLLDEIGWFENRRIVDLLESGDLKKRCWDVLKNNHGAAKEILEYYGKEDAAEEEKRTVLADFVQQFLNMAGRYLVEIEEQGLCGTSAERWDHLSFMIRSAGYDGYFWKEDMEYTSGMLPFVCRQLEKLPEEWSAQLSDKLNKLRGVCCSEYMSASVIKKEDKWHFPIFCCELMDDVSESQVMWEIFYMDDIFCMIGILALSRFLMKKGIMDRYCKKEM